MPIQIRVESRGFYSPPHSSLCATASEVQQILDRFRCHHKGCGKQLDTSQNIKKCGAPMDSHLTSEPRLQQQRPGMERNAEVGLERMCQYPIESE